jgi:hypothetical protein
MAIGREEGSFAEGLTGGKVGERGEGGEGIADAQEEASVSEAPEILAVIVEAPLSAADGVA